MSSGRTNTLTEGYINIEVSEAQTEHFNGKWIVGHKYTMQLKMGDALLRLLNDTRHKAFAEVASCAEETLTCYISPSVHLRRRGNNMTHKSLKPSYPALASL